MTQFRSPIIWRLILWFILLSLIPIGIVLVFIQRDVRTAFIDIELLELRHSADQFSESFISQYNAGQDITLETENEDDKAVILTSDGTYFAHPNPEKIGQPASVDFNKAILEEILSGTDKTLEDREFELLIATSHLPVNNLIAVVTIDSGLKTAPLAGVSRSITIQLIFSLLITSLAGGAAILTVLNPLGDLSNFAAQVGQGDFDIQLDDSAYEGELSVLAKAFNSMTRQLKNLISGLEMRVAERTANLEQATIQIEKRAGQLETIAEISRFISTEKDQEKLLPLITQIVSESFGFYHVGIFLLDENRKYALLRASNSSGGQVMLRRQHKLEVGQTGIVGNVTLTGNPRVALDTDEDAVFFNNPDLPETRSEMAVPLTSRGTIIGALDVQSTIANAFTDEDVSIITLLADQVAIAIDNVRLLEEAKNSLAESQSLFSDYLTNAWQRKSDTAVLGYQQTLAGGKVITSKMPNEQVSIPEQNTKTIAIPIQVRDQVIGVLNVSANSEEKTWNRDEVSIVEAVAERLGLALDNARLFEETSSRASRERLVSDITTKIRSTNDPQEMVKTAMEELQRALGATHIEIVPQKTAPPPD